MCETKGETVIKLCEQILKMGLKMDTGYRMYKLVNLYNSLNWQLKPVYKFDKIINKIKLHNIFVGLDLYLSCHLRSCHPMTTCTINLFPSVWSHPPISSLFSVVPQSTITWCLPSTPRFSPALESWSAQLWPSLPRFGPWILCQPIFGIC